MEKKYTEDVQENSSDSMFHIGMRDKAPEQVQEEVVQEKKKWAFWASGTVDRPMLIVILLLVCFGSVMVFSASYAYAYSRHGDSTFFIQKQLGFVILGFLVMLFISHINYKIIKAGSLPFYGVTVLLLILVLLIGVAAQAAQRWLRIGPISVQPSEIMKVALVLAIAWYGENYRKKIYDSNQSFKSKTINSVLKPGLFIMSPEIRGLRGVAKPFWSCAIHG